MLRPAIWKYQTCIRNIKIVWKEVSWYIWYLMHGSCMCFIINTTYFYVIAVNVLSVSIKETYCLLTWQQTSDRSNGIHTWWRHQMETFSAILFLCVGNSPVTSEFPSQRPAPRSFDVFYPCLNKRCEQTIETQVIWDAITLIMTSL